MIDLVLVTVVMKACQGHDVTKANPPSNYLGISTEGEETVIMTLECKLAKSMILAALNIYHKYITVDVRGNELLHVKLAKVLHKLLKSALLFYHKLCGDLNRVFY